MKLTNSTEEAQGNRQEDQSVKCSPNDKCQPDSEVVDFEDLAASEGEHENTEKLGDCDTREYRGSNIDKSSPGTSILSAEAMAAFEERRRWY